MRLAVSALLASSVWVGCSLADPVRPDPVELGPPFSLRLGESARIAGADLLVGFEDVSLDSRCPKGERCITAGDAVARISLRRNNGLKAMLELHTSARATQVASAEGHEVRLLRLEPDPIAGKAITKADYRATLTVGRVSVAAER